MLFNSIEFAVFFPVVTLLFFLIGPTPRVWLLLVASCIFYMAWNWHYWFYIGFLFALIGIDYTAGLFIEPAKGFRRKLILGISLAANLSLLGVFKYFNFLNGNAAALAGVAGWSYAVPNLALILPIGLSFHTFQALSYTMEVYYGRCKAERNLPIYALYVLFYPQLVAGPIERPQNLIHQFREQHRFDYNRFVRGIQLMLTGLFKKMAIADRLSVVVDSVYDKPTHYSGAQLLLATYFFAAQIFCDFSGYTDIARGAATIMGFQIMENFERPYLAPSISAFWRRWHISLSTWFRDYVFIPLGGSRGSRARTYFNLAVVFLLSGLWHGANWTYVVWGALHGFFLITYLSTGSIRAKLAVALGLDKRPLVHHVIAAFISSNLVAFTWIFFRARNLTDALTIVRRIITDTVPSRFGDMWQGIDATQCVIGLALILALLAAEVVGGKKTIWTWVARQPTWLRWSAHYLFVVVLLVLILTNPLKKSQQFIYFQF